MSASAASAEDPREMLGTLLRIIDSDARHPGVAGFLRAAGLHARLRWARPGRIRMRSSRTAESTSDCIKHRNRRSRFAGTALTFVRPDLLASIWTSSNDLGVDFEFRRLGNDQFNEVGWCDPSGQSRSAWSKPAPFRHRSAAPARTPAAGIFSRSDCLRPTSTGRKPIGRGSDSSAWPSRTRIRRTSVASATPSTSDSTIRRTCAGRRCCLTRKILQS